MNSILWYQHADLNVGDVIYYNGSRVEDKALGMQYFDQIKKRADIVIKKQKPWCGKVSGYFFMKGYLNSRDERDRIMTFLYVTDEKNYREACIKELNAAGLQMADETKECLNKPSKKSLKIYALCIVIAALLSAIIISVANNNNQNENNKLNEKTELTK